MEAQSAALPLSLVSHFRRCAPPSPSMMYANSSEGGCFRGVDFLSDGAPEFVAIDEESNHQIMHTLGRIRGTTVVIPKGLPVLGI